MLAVTLALGLFFLIAAPRKTIITKSVSLDAAPTNEFATKTEVSRSDFAGPFDLVGNHNVQIIVRSAVDNSWTYVEGDLYNETTGESQPFGIPVEYYHGYDDGNWSEGSQQNAVYLSAPPAGRYTARFEVQWPSRSQAPLVTIEIRQGVPRILNLLLTLLAISIVPLIVMAYHVSFESRRWAESSLTPDTVGNIFSSNDNDASSTFSSDDEEDDE
jgi:hypothetical protein